MSGISCRAPSHGRQVSSTRTNLTHGLRKPALDPMMIPRIVPFMQVRGAMREVGVIKAPPLVRFGRNQRRAALLAARSGEPSGVKRFKTWSEFSLWQKQRPRVA